MTNASDSKCVKRVHGQSERDDTPGLLPKRQNTICAEVLAMLLDGCQMTTMNSVFSQNTTRLSSVIHILQGAYGWHIHRHKIEVNTGDGRSVLVAVYYLGRSAIDEAVSRGARTWVDAVKVIRAKQKQAASGKKFDTPGSRTVTSSAWVEPLGGATNES